MHPADRVPVSGSLCPVNLAFRSRRSRSATAPSRPPARWPSNPAI